uniref:Uncharacterized protein n=2 Tax=Arundo donax TaxID=35708 RepID=A0A0A9GPM0_ARUDO
MPATAKVDSRAVRRVPLYCTALRSLLHLPLTPIREVNTFSSPAVAVWCIGMLGAGSSFSSRVRLYSCEF